MTLGSHYQSSNHQEVLEQIAHPVINRIIDITLIISCFVVGFVMVAGAGANLQQQFGLPSWLGVLFCSLLVIVIAFLDFDKITRVLGVFTPVIVVMILAVAGYTFIGKSYDYEFTAKHKKDFHKLGEMSVADTKGLEQDIKSYVKDVVENTDDLQAYAKENLSMEGSPLKKEEKTNK